MLTDYQISHVRPILLAPVGCDGIQFRHPGWWLAIAVPGWQFDEKILGYANDTVVNVVQRSDAGFAGLVGLPLLRMMEYGGDAESFWIRALSPS